MRSIDINWWKLLALCLLGVGTTALAAYCEMGFPLGIFIGAVSFHASRRKP